MSNSIAAEEIYLGSLLEDYVLSVPYYQRPYSWEITQVSDLVTDLQEASKEANIKSDSDDLDNEISKVVGKLPPYFFGSIVLSKTEQADGDWYYDIVDGQQRLATLTSLLSVLRYMETDREPWITPLIFPQANPTSVKQKREHRLNMGNHDTDFFRKYIQSVSPDNDEIGIGAIANDKVNADDFNDSEKRMLVATQHLINRLNTMSPTERKTLITFVISRCQFVMVKNENFETAYRVFSIMNNRGLELNHADILKAQVLGADYRELAEKWENIEQQLGRDHFQELFSHVRMIYREQKQRESILVEIKKYVEPEKDPEQFVEGILEKYGDAMSTILEQNYKHSDVETAERINELLRMLNDHDNFDWLPPTIYFLAHTRNEPEKLVNFLELLERLAAWIFITRQNSTKRLARYGQLLRVMKSVFETNVDDNANADTAYQDVSEIFRNAESPIQLKDDEKNELVTVLKGNLYNHKAGRYVLLRLSALMTEGETSNSGYKGDQKVTVEHVLPQTPKSDSDWLKLFPDTTVRKSWTHKIANLVLLSGRKNSSAKNYDFKKKVETYFKGKMANYSITIDVLNESNSGQPDFQWSPDHLEDRQNKLLNILIDEWNLS